jgi:hypothetical protein
MSDGRCPICQGPAHQTPRYPDALCAECVKLAVDDRGRALRFYNQSLSGGFEAHREDGTRSTEHVCFVRGVRCWADEAHFGGIVIRPRPA